MKRFTPEQERILNAWARTASELRRAFTYTSASNTETQGFGFLLNKELDPGRFYINVRQSNGANGLETTSILSFNRDSFYLERTSNPNEIMVNFSGAVASSGSSPGISSVTFSDGIPPDYSSDKLTFNKADFYFASDSAGKPIVNLIADELTVGTADGAIPINRNQLYEAVKILRFNEDDFYLSANSLLTDVTVNSLLVRTDGRPGGQKVLGGNTTSAAKLKLAGNTDLGINSFVSGGGCTGPVVLNQQLQFEYTGGALPTGVNALIEVPNTFVLNGSGASATNVFIGFNFRGVTLINNVQTFTGSNAFIANNTIREIAAIIGSHNAFSQMGFNAQPRYEIGHNSTSTEGIPTLSGYNAEPTTGRQSGKTGSGIVDVMAGYTTNNPNPLRAFFSGQQVTAGATVSKYAHFIAFSQGELLNLGTITEEVGVDLQNINVGATTISFRSTGTTASMRHAGGAVFRSASIDPNSLVIESNSTHGIVIDGNNADIGVLTIVNADTPTFSPIFMSGARSRGSLSTPTAVIDADFLGKFSVFGYDGTSYEPASTISFRVDATVSNGIVPASFNVTTINAGGTSVSALSVRSNATVNSYGRFGNSSVSSSTLSGDVNNYDPEGVGASGIPAGVWRLTASGANRTITGILAPQTPGAADYQYLNIINVSSNSVILARENASSTAANRILFSSPALNLLTLATDQAAMLVYDVASSRWRVLSTTGVIT